jgi:DNA processing protein
VARQVLQCLKPDQSIHLDVIVDTLEGASASEIIAALFELEILGLARQLPGRNFVKVW